MLKFKNFLKTAENILLDNSIFYTFNHVRYFQLLVVNPFLDLKNPKSLYDVVSRAKYIFTVKNKREPDNVETKLLVIKALGMPISDDLIRNNLNLDISMDMVAPEVNSNITSRNAAKHYEVRNHFEKELNARCFTELGGAFNNGIDHFLLGYKVDIEKNTWMVNQFHYHHWRQICSSIDDSVYSVKNMALCSDFYHGIIDLYNKQQRFFACHDLETGNIFSYLRFVEPKINREENEQVIVYAGPNDIFTGFLPECLPVLPFEENLDEELKKVAGMESR